MNKHTVVEQVGDHCISVSIEPRQLGPDTVYDISGYLDGVREEFSHTMGTIGRAIEERRTFLARLTRYAKAT